MAILTGASEVSSGVRPSVHADRIELRWLTPDDWRNLRRMRLRALKRSPQSFLAKYKAEKDRKVFNEARWRAEFDRGDWVFACINGRPIGMMGVTWYEDIPPEGKYIEYLWINKRRRRKGVASEFVRKVIGKLAGDEVGSVWLWILDGNDAARKLYEKLKFEVEGDPKPLPDCSGRFETRMTLGLYCSLSDRPAGDYYSSLAS